MKIASTVEEIATENIFKKEIEKPVEKVEKVQFESRTFQIKPTGTGFRNYENKQEIGLCTVKFGSGFDK